MYAPYKKPTKIFGNVWFPILGKLRRCASWLTDIDEMQTEVSSTADNADITQSQERDTTYRRMQEVNSLCTDSGPLSAEYCIVGIPRNTII